MQFPHWRFFEALDDELHSLSRIIEFDRANFATFSVQISRLYLSVGSEIDVVAKLLCGQIDSTANCRSMDDYRSVITQKFKHLTSLKIALPAQELEFQPWESWASGTNPLWWKAYNSVKHERSKCFKEANIGNLLESAAGLLVLLVYYHQPQLYSRNQPVVPDFKTMRVEHRYVHILGIGADYSLPDFGKSYP